MLTKFIAVMTAGRNAVLLVGTALWSAPVTPVWRYACAIASAGHAVVMCACDLVARGPAVGFFLELNTFCMHLAGVWESLVRDHLWGRSNDPIH